MEQQSDQQLVVACQGGDKTAYSWLIKKYSRGVFAVCMSVLGNAADAEDIAQEALLKGFIRIKGLQDTGQFKSWIFRIAKNLCIDYIRRQKVHRQALKKQQQKPIVLDEKEQDFSRLEAAIERLDEKYRLPLLLYYFQQKSTEAVAELLGISPAGVCSRLSRARQQLRVILDHQRGVS